MFRPAEVLRDGRMIPKNVYLASYSGAWSLNVHTLKRSAVIPGCAAATVRQKTSKGTTDGRVERRIRKEEREGKEGEPRRKRGTGKMKEENAEAGWRLYPLFGEANPASIQVGEVLLLPGAPTTTQPCRHRPGSCNAGIRGGNWEAPVRTDTRLI